MKAFIGIFYIRAAFKVNIHGSSQILYHGSSNELLAETTSWKIFHFLTRFIEFDDKAWICMHHRFLRNRKWKECLNENSSPYLAIDETLYPYSGSIDIKQYNPSKLGKYGLLYRSLCDAIMPNTYYTLAYVAKPSKTNIEASKYYTSMTEEYTKYLVNGVNHYDSIDGSNISMDRYLTSLPIAQWALENKITIFGTMRLHRKSIPKDIKTMMNWKPQKMKEGNQTYTNYMTIQKLA